MGVASYVILIIIGIIAFGLAFNRFAAWLEVARLKNEETPEAWVKHLQELKEYQSLSVNERENFWLFVKVILANVDLNSFEGGHIDIDKRLKMLLFFHTGHQTEKSWLKGLREINIVLNKSEEDSQTGPFIRLEEHSIKISK
ncbi:MAG: hypothetical protein GY909_18970 [Oligoflexia bacterium]|nr:hypothetical protein [Oligoflexia bacterium]